MTTLPQVGAQAVILGMSAFNANARTVNAQLASMGRSAFLLERTTQNAFRTMESDSNAAFTAIKAGAAVAAGALVAVTAAAVTAGAKYGQQVAFIGAVSESTTANIRKLDEGMLELSRRSTQSASNLAEMSGEMIKAGFDITQVTSETMKAVNDLVVASNGELAAAKAATLAQVGTRAFGATVVEVANAATAAVQRSTLTFTQFSDAMRQGGGVAARLGLTIQEYSAAVAVMGQTLNSGSEIGTGFRMMLQRLNNPSKEAAELMQKYRISLYDANGAARPFIDILRNLEENFSDAAVAEGRLTKAQQEQTLATLFGGRAIKTVSALINGGTEEYLKMLDATERLKAADLANAMLAPTAAKLKMIENNINALGIAFSKGLDPFINHAAGSMLKFLQSVSLKDLQAFVYLIGTTLYNAFSSIGVILNEFVLPGLNVLRIAVYSIVSTIGEMLGMDQIFRTIADTVGNVARIMLVLAMQGVQFLTTKLFDLSIAIHSSRAAFEDFKAGAARAIANVPAQFQALTGRVTTATDAVRDFVDRLAKNPAVIAAVRTAVALLGVELAGRLVTGLRASAAAFFAWATAALTGARSAVVAATSTATAWLAASASVVASTLRVTAALGALMIAASRTAATAVASFATFAAFYAMQVTGVVAGSTAQLIVVFGLLAVRAVTTAALMSQAFAITAAQAMLSFGRTAVSVVTAGIGVMFLMAQSAVLSANAIAVSFAVNAARGMIAFAKVAVMASLTAARAFIMTLAASALAAFGAVLSALAPFMLGIGAIATVAALIATAWAQNWGDIQGVAGRVLNGVLQIINSFLDKLAGLPLIGEHIGAARAALVGFVQGVPAMAATAGNAVGQFVADTIASFKALDEIKLPDLKDFTAELEAMEAAANEARDAAAKAAEEARNAPLAPEGEGTEPGSFPDAGGGGGGRGGLDKLEKATDKANELLRDFHDDVRKENAKTAADIAKLYERTTADMANAIIKADAEIASAIADAEKKVTEISADRGIQEDAERRREALEDEIDVITKNREWMRETEEIAHERGLEDIDRQADQDREARERGYREELDDLARARDREREVEDRNFDKGHDALKDALAKEQDLREAALRKQHDAMEEALRKAQDIRERDLRNAQKAREQALQDVLDEEARQRDATRDLAKIEAEAAKDTAEAQAKFESDIARGVKRSIAETRLKDKMDEINKELAADKAALEERQKEAEEDRKFEAEQEAKILALRAKFEEENLALKAQFEAEEVALRERTEAEITAMRERHARERVELEERLEKEALDRRRQRQDEDIAYEKEQDAKLRAFRDEEDRKELEAKRTREDEERRRKAILENQDEQFRKDMEAKRRVLENKLKDEDMRRQFDRIRAERDERIRVATQTLAEEQKKSREKLAQDIVDLKENLEERIKTIQTQYNDRLEDLMRDAGASINPLVDNITGNMIEGLNGIRDAASEAVRKLAEVFGATEALNRATEARERARAAAGLESHQYGGVVGGPFGSRQLIEAHGGERFEGIGWQAQIMTAVRAAEAMWSSGIGGSTVVNNTNYTVNANYGRVQDEGTVSRDLSALVSLTRR